MSFVVVHGARVRFREEGESNQPTVVLLHMAGGGSSVWDPVARLLGRRVRVLAPDFPAHGQSERAPVSTAAAWPGVSAHLAGLAHWTVAFLDAVGVPRAVLVGHSMGGAVALCTALLAPDRVRAVATVACAGRLNVPADLMDLVLHHPTALAQRYAGVALPHGAGAAVGAQVRPVFPQAEPDVVRADFLGVHGVDLLPLVARLDLPALVVGGMQDGLTPPEDVRALAAALPRARLQWMEGVGHMVPREQPAQTARLLGDFVAGLPTGTTS